jgi:hypothetical protein
MAFTNSSLATYTKLSPNHSGKRTHAIDRITPHCVVGQLSVESIANCFAPKSRQASCNYAIGKDGKVGLICEEKNRSWCTSSSANDQRAITIEIASDTKHPYTMNDVAYKKLIDLCVDICKRNGKTKLLWFSDEKTALKYTPKSDEMLITVHRWFANKSCPGDWLFSRLGKVADEVTERLTPKKETTKKETTKKETSKKESFFPSRGYFAKGDVSPNVGKIATFMRKMFPSYTSEKALGNTYGDNLIKAVKEFQKRTGLKVDGYFGEKTLKKLEGYGFKK